MGRRIGKVKKISNFSVIKSGKSGYLTPTELKILQYIEKNKLISTQKEIANEVKVSPAIVRSALKKLIEVDHPLVKELERGKNKPLIEKNLKKRRDSVLYSKLLKEGLRSEAMDLRYGTKGEREVVRKRNKHLLE